MKKYRYLGPTPQVMPTLTPPREISTGDVIEVDDDTVLGPDFELVTSSKTKTPDPAPES